MDFLLAEVQVEVVVVVVVLMGNLGVHDSWVACLMVVKVRGGAVFVFV